MGMYTEFVLGCELEKNTPDIVIETLDFMINGGIEDELEKLPDHELFKDTRWRFMLTCSSYYFPRITHSELNWDNIGNCYYLGIRSNFKNYNDEIDKFLNWIKPYINPGYGYDKCFLGYWRYEECDEPVLIYYENI